MTEHPIPDVQGTPDTRQIPIERVGIRDLRIPLTFIGKDKHKQATIADVEMTVALPHEQKGTHMSRFIELINDVNSVELADIKALHQLMLARLNAVSGTLTLNFAYFMKKTAPVSQVNSLLDYDISLTIDGGKKAAVFIEVAVPVTSLCPCSKEISRYGAHNQRSLVIMLIEYDDISSVDIEGLIRLAEEEGSCEIWAALKRPDEKYVTEKAYENPKFVEDIVRDVALRLNKDEHIIAYRVSSENFESIHNHSAYAMVECDRRMSD